LVSGPSSAPAAPGAARPSAPAASADVCSSDVGSSTVPSSFSSSEWPDSDDVGTPVSQIPWDHIAAASVVKKERRRRRKDMPLALRALPPDPPPAVGNMVGARALRAMTISNRALYCSASEGAITSLCPAHRLARRLLGQTPTWAKRGGANRRYLAIIGGPHVPFSAGFTELLPRPFIPTDTYPEGRTPTCPVCICLSPLFHDGLLWHQRAESQLADQDSSFPVPEAAAPREAPSPPFDLCMHIDGARPVQVNISLPRRGHPESLGLIEREEVVPPAPRVERRPTRRGKRAGRKPHGFPNESGPRHALPAVATEAVVCCEPLHAVQSLPAAATAAVVCLTLMQCCSAAASK
jgi:hypothetical protein